jgi:hypothetical protein
MSAADTTTPTTVTGSEARAATATGNANTAAEQQLQSAAPTHLLVLCHGLSGGPGELGYLEEAIVREGGSSIVVLNSSSNQGKTYDGIEAGGKRVAEEVKAVIAATPSLQVTIATAKADVFCQCCVTQCSADHRFYCCCNVTVYQRSGQLSRRAVCTACYQTAVHS